MDTEVLEKIDQLNAKVDQLLQERSLSISPWLRGDAEAARFAGYKSRTTFLTWARRHRIKPMQEDGINFWDKAAIVKARQKQQRY